MAWNQSSGPVKPVKPKSPGALRGVLAGAVVVAIGIAAFLFLSGERDAPKDERKRGSAAIKEVKPAAAPKAVAEEPAEDPKKAAQRERALKLKAMSPAERMEFLLEEAKSTPLDLTPSSNRVFRTGTEQVMSWIFTTRLGDPPPPLPKLTIRDEAHMAEILISDNPVFETDSERAKEAKQTVELVKKEVIKYLKEGGSVDEFLQYHRDQLMQAYHEYTDAQKSAMEMVRNGEDADLCAEYIKKVNEKLSERGIEKKVSVPDKVFEKFTGRVPARPQEKVNQQEVNQ